MREVANDARVVADSSPAVDSMSPAVDPAAQLGQPDAVNPAGGATNPADHPAEDPTPSPRGEHEQLPNPPQSAPSGSAPRTPPSGARDVDAPREDDALDIDLPLDEPASAPPLEIDLPVDFSPPSPAGGATTTPSAHGAAPGPAPGATPPPEAGHTGGAELTGGHAPAYAGSAAAGAGTTPGASGWAARGDDSQPSWNRPSGVSPLVSPITRAERRAAEAAAANRALGIEQVHTPRGQFLWALARMAFAAVFLWTFLDALFGFNAPTASDAAWRAGGSPSEAYLGAGDGPFAGLFTALAGRAWVDWVFMIALLVVGLALLLGIAVVPAAVGAVLLLVGMWAADLPVPGNPVLDPRLLAALVIVCIVVSGAGLRYSLAPWWRRTPVVQKVRAFR